MLQTFVNVRRKLSPSKRVSVLPYDRHADWCWSHNQLALHNRSRTVNGMQAWRHTTGSLLCKTRKWRACQSWESVGPTSVLCGMPIHIRRHRRHSLCGKCWLDVGSRASWSTCPSRNSPPSMVSIICLLRNASGVDATTPVLDIRAHSVISGSCQSRVDRAVLKTWEVDTPLQVSNCLRNQGFAATRPGHHIPAREHKNAYCHRRAGDAVSHLGRLSGIPQETELQK